MPVHNVYVYFYVATAMACMIEGSIIAMFAISLHSQNPPEVWSHIRMFIWHASRLLLTAALYVTDWFFNNNLSQNRQSKRPLASQEPKFNNEDTSFVVSDYHHTNQLLLLIHHISCSQSIDQLRKQHTNQCIKKFSSGLLLPRKPQRRPDTGRLTYNEEQLFNISPSPTKRSLFAQDDSLNCDSFHLDPL